MIVFATLDADLNPVRLQGRDADLMWKRQPNGSYRQVEHLAALADIAAWNDGELVDNRIAKFTVADPQPWQTGPTISLTADAHGVIGCTPTYGTMDLGEARARKLAQVQQAKSAALAQMTYAVGGQTYPVTLSVQDQVDVQMQLQLLQAQPPGTTIQWEIVCNTFLTWTAADLSALLAAGVAHVSAVYANTKTLADAVNAADDPETILAVDHTAGWPA